MNYLYLTTDSFEAEELIEETEVDQEPKYKYSDLDPKMSQTLVSKLGFNPMCSVQMNCVREREIEVIAKKLVKEGLCVATEIDGKITQYIPEDLESRTKLLKQALTRNNILTSSGHRSHIYDSFSSLTIYSNDPTRIRVI